MADEPLRRALLLKTTLEILRDAGGPLAKGEVVEQLRRRVALNPNELSVDDSGLPRYERAITFLSGNAGTIGWITKIGGWAITEAGIDALESFEEDADRLATELDQRHRAVDRLRKEAQRNLDDVQQLIADAVAVIEPGQWTSHNDLAELTDTSSEDVGHFLASFKVKVPNSHRVLTAEGTVPPEGMLHFKYRGVDLHERLSNEGLEFDTAGKASLRQRLTAEDLRELFERVAPEPATTQRAWMVRGTSVEGYNLVDEWLAGGYVSLAASQLTRTDPVMPEDLKEAVARDYGHKSASYQEQRLTEFERFLHQMREGEMVLTVSHGHAYLGEIAGPALFVDSEGGRSNLRRHVIWLNTNEPISRDNLRAPLPALLADQLYVVDLTEADKELARLAEPFRDQPGPAPTPELAFPDVTAELANDLLMDEEWLREVADRLWHRKQIVLYGPPGTGKTWLARKLARHLAGGQDPAVKLVQFHPSYTYEDFFEGYRPRSVNGQLSFALEAGPFRKFAEDAEDNQATPYILIIDEINRANLAKVFGELYFLLEYRDAAINLQYSPTKQFSLPENVFVIGTMNTADRSIALVDAAMRRRFAFIELHPRATPVKELLPRWLERNKIDSPAADLLDALNERIADEGYAIGPSYFMHPDIYDRPDGIDVVWRTEIMPLLEELHYGQGRTAVADKYDLAAIRKAVAARQVPQQETS